MPGETEKTKYHTEWEKLFSDSDILANINALARVDRLERCSSFIDSSTFISILNAAPEDNKKGILVRILKDLQTSYQVIDHTKKEQSFLDLEELDSLNSNLDELDALLKEHNFFDTELITQILPLFVEGLLSSITNLEDLAQEESLIKSITQRLQNDKTTALVVNKLMIYFLAGVHANDWLKNLSRQDRVTLTDVIRTEVLTFIDTRIQNWDSMKHILMTLVAGALEKIGQSSFKWIKRLHDFEAQNEDLSYVGGALGKRFIEEVAASNKLPSQWSEIDDQIQEQSPFLSLLGKFLFSFEVNYPKNIIADLRTDSSVLEEPSVALYRRELLLIEKLEDYLLQHSDAIVSWQSTSREMEYDGLSGKIENGIKVRELTNTVFYLFFGYQKGSRTLWTSKATLSEMTELSRTNFASAVFLFKPKLLEEIPHTLQVLDTLTFDDTHLNESWVTWYSSFRPELASLLDDNLESRVSRLSLGQKTKEEMSDENTPPESLTKKST